MPAAETFALVPKPGRGLFTAWSRFAMGDFDDSFSTWRDLVVQDNCWRVMLDHTVAVTFATGGGLGTGPVWAIYYYNAINTASSAALPVTIPMAHIGGSLNPIAGTAVLGRYDTNAVILTTTAPHELCFQTIKNRLFVAGSTLSGGSVPTIVTKYPAATSYPWGKAVPTVNLTYTPYTNLGATGDKPALRIYVNLAGSGTEITTAAGVNTVTSAGAGSFVTGAPSPWVGKTVIVNNGANTYRFNSITNANNATLTTNGDPGAAGVPYEVHYGALSWTEQPPLYAYSYYNPTTGHSTSRSPILRISEHDMTDVGVEVTIPTTGDANYTRILLFRNEVQSEGESLYFLRPDAAHGGSATINADGMIENTAAGTVTYWDNSPDSELQQAPIGKFQAPEDNEPPPADIKFFEYWNNRIWYTTVSAPWRLGYSRETSPDELGIGEESFPPRFFLDVSTNDGLITGMKVVGGALLVCTDSFMYFVEGQTEGSYRLTRISARGAGVGHFAIDEHPGDTTNNAASAFYISRDKRLWRHEPGGRLQDLGAPIQNKLNDAPLNMSKPYIVKVFRVGRHWFCAVGIFDSVNLNKYNFFFFDFDNSSWHDFGAADGVRDILCLGAGTEWTNGAVLHASLGRNTANQLYGFMFNTNSSASAKFTSQWLDMKDPMGKKTLEDIVVYVSDELAAGWVCKVKFDGNDAGAFTTLTETVTLASPRSRGKGILHFNAGLGPKQWHSIKIELTYPGGGATRQEAYRVEVKFNRLSRGTAGMPS